MCADNMGRRTVLKTLSGATIGVGFAGCSNLEGGSTNDGPYPNEEIDVIVPVPSGGGFDTYARIAVPYWEEYLPNDATMVVENVPGGGTLTGIQQAMNSDTDGHTMAIWEGFHAANFHVGRDNLGFDIREASHIGVMTQSPFSVIVMDRTGITSWDDLVANISDYNIATAGRGSFPHTSWLILGELTGEFSREDMNFVHYDGTGDVVGALERDEANLFMVSSSSGRNVVDSLEATMLVSFVQDPDSEAGEFFDEYAEYYASDLDVNNIDTFSDIAVFRRFFTGPPGVSDDVLETQRDVFMDIVNDSSFVDEANERGRPIINPDDHTAVTDAIETSIDIIGEDPYRSMLEDVIE